MKANLIYLLVPALACVAQLTPNLVAQPPERDRGDRPFRRFQDDRRARFANLTDDERTRLRAAHEKAMQDPAVQAAREKMRLARRGLREGLRPALLKADRTLQPILDKMRPEKPDKQDRQ